jgi:hypothetical protein
MYQGTAQTHPFNPYTIPNSNSILTWQTTNVKLNYSGKISFGGGSGDARWFNKPAMELLPDSAKFHFRGCDRVDLDWSGASCNFEKTVSCLRVRESDGTTGVPNVTFDWQIHGSPPDQWVPGQTGPSGNLLHLYDGYNNSKTRYRAFWNGRGPAPRPEAG